MSEMRSLVHKYLIEKTDFLSVKDRLTEDQLRVYVDKAITELCKDQNLTIITEERITLIRELVSAVMSYGPLRPLMEDQSITEVMINGYNTVYVQKHGRIEKTKVRFNDNHHLAHTVQKI